MVLSCDFDRFTGRLGAGLFKVTTLLRRLVTAIECLHKLAESVAALLKIAELVVTRTPRRKKYRIPRQSVLPRLKKGTFKITTPHHRLGPQPTSRIVRQSSHEVRSNEILSLTDQQHGLAPCHCHHAQRIPWQELIVPTKNEQYRPGNRPEGSKSAVRRGGNRVIVVTYPPTRGDKLQAVWHPGKGTNGLAHGHHGNTNLISSGDCCQGIGHVMISRHPQLATCADYFAVPATMDGQHLTLKGSAINGRGNQAKV
jgi:hypothetical protein